MKFGHLCFVALLATSTQAFASTTICQVDGKLSDPEVVSWDSVSQKAKIKYWTGRSYEGTLTLTRKHNTGTKVNLSFKPDPIYGDEYEYIVFSVPGGGHRVLGAGFVHTNGTKRLNYGLGSYEATCSSL